MAETSEKSKICLKILVDRENERVLFAEADHSFVDVLFSFMTLPMGTIVRLLAKQSDEKFKALGSLNTLYESLGNLPATCFRYEEYKGLLLNPGNPSEYRCKNLKLNVDDSEPTRLLICEKRNGSLCSQVPVRTSEAIICPYCGNSMKEKGKIFSFRPVFSNCDKGKFVTEATSFLVSDSLHVMPNTSGSGMRLLNDLGIPDTRHLEERTVDIGLEEIRNLLKFALVCKSPLTYLLLPKRDQRYYVLPRKRKNPEEQVIGCETATNSKKMTLNVTLQKSTSKILFAEADEEFVGFVISFLAIPLGAVIGKFNGSTSMGSIDNLYTSILNMSVGRFMKSQYLKDVLLPGDFDPIAQRRFVKGPSIFMVTDDLVITPSSSISSINFLNKLKVPLSDIEEHEVSIGMEEVFRILKASLKSSSALTNGLKLPMKNPNQES